MDLTAAAVCGFPFSFLVQTNHNLKLVGISDGKHVEKSDDYLQGHALKRKNVTKKVTIALNACLQDGKGVEKKQRLP